ncbi:hypothetical protein GCM10007385_36670 [Tateyamaria omphalii]|uniref:hypothetical protein n=1 Tax=Tateyamaria omphalii TaxID=299262 RepID=UPI001672C329|nr:hypothetical protein [Tateyamaria omphalii]GGX64116.1 hypothetical protein GCM10007385_36670 [Tateyamaria omphalii]
MAKAYFINATPFAMTVNLNANPKNNPLDRFEVVKRDNTPVMTYHSWPATIAAYPGRNAFGGSNLINAVTVFLESHTAPLVFNVQSKVSIALDLFFYVRDGRINGVDMTGDSSGITVVPWTQGLGGAMRAQSLGTRSIQQWRK